MTTIDLDTLSTPEHGYTVDDKDDEAVGEPDPLIVGRALAD
jgi:hypothetical protein